MSDSTSDLGKWWVVGASEGLGRAVAEKLHAAGAELVLSARSEDRLRDLADTLDGAEVITVDVTDDTSVQAAAETAGSVDGLLYCVGAYEPMKATEWKTDAVLTMAETNFLGSIRVLGAVLPGFVARDAGRVVLVGSLSGFRGLPGAIGYGASKAGLMHLAENLLADLHGTGVTVQRVNPGFIDTRLTRKNDFKMPQLMQPEAAAEKVMEAIRSGRFSTSFPSPFSWLFTAGRYLPLSWFQRVFRRG
ncbi:SDR family NAD(P)-dependent oxidoreductase [Vannielia litorea]|uniref:SDR family NAD(P)-dependent oxidoreductase n=1 Tax=Vannielia litorea TaxID=1217970 RepID=UPI001BCCCFE6|nr:SDR family NAD(P)-dependent oxidoreductase [Vannielia litorea]MBS8228514.1 SDR family NAD(P)-dependent oxidoreductase [Vannielia litorea]